MLGISRWSEQYGYKTIERFFDKKINWLSLKWQLVKQTLGNEVTLVADETTVSKLGKCTYGVDDFYSGVHNRASKEHHKIDSFLQLQPISFIAKLSKTDECLS